MSIAIPRQTIPNSLPISQTPIPLEDDPSYPEEQKNINSFWDPKEYLDVLEHYTEDNLVPKDVKESNWAVFGKALINTFLETQDTALIDLWNNILRIDQLMLKPAHALTNEEIKELDQMQLYFYLTAKRAIGTDKQKINERVLQVTQIGQRISSTSQQQLKQGGGFFSKIGRMF